MLLLLLIFGSALGEVPSCLSRFGYEEIMYMKHRCLEDTVVNLDTQVTELVAIMERLKHVGKYGLPFLRLIMTYPGVASFNFGSFRYF